VNKENLLIKSPQVVADRVTEQLVFFPFDEKAVTSIVDSIGIQYKLHRHARTNITMKFDSSLDFSTAALALKLHYSQFN